VACCGSSLVVGVVSAAVFASVACSLVVGGCCGFFFFFGCCGRFFVFCRSFGCSVFVRPAFWVGAFVVVCASVLVACCGGRVLVASGSVWSCVWFARSVPVWGWFGGVPFRWASVRLLAFCRCCCRPCGCVFRLSGLVARCSRSFWSCRSRLLLRRLLRLWCVSRWGFLLPAVVACLGVSCPSGWGASLFCESTDSTDCIIFVSRPTCTRALRDSLWLPFGGPLWPFYNLLALKE